MIPFRGKCIRNAIKATPAGLVCIQRDWLDGEESRLKWTLGLSGGFSGQQPSPFNTGREKKQSAPSLCKQSTGVAPCPPCTASYKDAEWKSKVCSELCWHSGICRDLFLTLRRRTVKHKLLGQTAVALEDGEDPMNCCTARRVRPH